MNFLGESHTFCSSLAAAAASSWACTSSAAFSARTSSRALRNSVSFDFSSACARACA